jgi:ABC-type phosphate/phosphonate transport system substrate-binding protein
MPYKDKQPHLLELFDFMNNENNLDDFKSAKQISRYFSFIFLVIFPAFTGANDFFAEKTLRIGFHRPSFHEYSREDLEVSVKIITEEMGRDIGIQTAVFIYEDIKLMNADFVQGKINLIFLSTLPIANEVDNTLLADGFKFLSSGGNSSNLVILTRKNEGMDDFKSLRGKKLGLIENDPVTDLYVNFLSEANFKKDFIYVFENTPREKKSYQAVLKLFFGQVDVVCVYENFFRTAAELNPQILSKIQIIDHTEGIIQNAGFFHKNVDAEFRENVIAAVLKLNTYPRGLQFLEIFKTEQAMRISPADLLSIKELYGNYKHLQQTNGRK